jgi:hypothetical protein
MQIIAFIALSDLFGNIAYVPTERPVEGTFICGLEAFLNDALYPCSWLWTTLLVRNLYVLAVEKRIPTIHWKEHLFCWLFPVFLFVISVPFSVFRTLPSRPYEVCTDNAKVADLYHGITYYGMFFSALIVMIYYRYQTLLLEKGNEEMTSNDRAFKIAKAGLLFYPRALFLCWIPHVSLVYIYYAGINGHLFNIVYFYTDILKIIHGAITAIIFFYFSPEARRLWYRLIIGTLTNNHVPVDARTISDNAVITENCLEMRDSSINAGTASSFSRPPTIVTNPILRETFEDG